MAQQGCTAPRIYPVGADNQVCLKPLSIVQFQGWLGKVNLGHR